MTLVTSTYTWLSIISIQFRCQSANEADVFHAKIAKGLECGFSSPPDGHCGGFLSDLGPPVACDQPAGSEFVAPGSERGVPVSTHGRCSI